MEFEEKEANGEEIISKLKEINKKLGEKQDGGDE
jgi:hypothetical protein